MLPSVFLQGEDIGVLIQQKKEVGQERDQLLAQVCVWWRVGLMKEVESEG